MIRKDQLPDIWGDQWKATGEEWRVESGGRIVMCSPEDAPLFMLREDAGYKVVRGHERMKLVLGEGVEMELYRPQFMGGEQVSDLEITMEAGSRLKMCTITLGGQHVRNNIVVRMVGEGCDLEANGLYLIDREQQCDNYIFVEHAKPHCNSRELYKGIIDDAARARFNGHVLVQDGAVKTEAYMTNRNILLTDKAHVDTRPFLEIYNDDVKCSHGSTIGQLDEQAKFYLMTRGISERTAVTMLSYAFCDEVIRSIGIPSLRETMGDMVKKRLHGELTSCEECAIKCSSPCNGPDAHFDIDVTKL